MSAGQLRIIKSRIRSVENTKKITRAMEMVSAAKLRRFQILMTQAQPYTEELETILLRLFQDQREKSETSQNANQPTHPFFQAREEKKSAVILFTSDSGLCGPYNMELSNLAHQFLDESQSQTLLFGVGKSGITTLKKRAHTFEESLTYIRPDQVESTIVQLATRLREAYLNQTFDSAYVVSSHFINATTYKPQVQKILPLEIPNNLSAVEKSSSIPYLYEPSPEMIFERLIPLYFEAKIRMIFLESLVSEHTARMNAMHQATKNASEMIDSLVLVRNKVRQAIITKEIIEIVSGSRALKK